jgi:hypothetical protein
MALHERSERVRVTRPRLGYERSVVLSIRLLVRLPVLRAVSKNYDAPAVAFRVLAAPSGAWCYPRTFRELSEEL